uniref:Calponin-homology (CH) domain-containing protein n=1 Tax=Timema bartmani TaxID=61472 RepID=A0A7R9F3R2_9NEOP|nr:unnamed protein product [Timema bartmani]
MKKNSYFWPLDERNLLVWFSKLPPAERGLVLAPDNFTLQPLQEASVVITWCPTVAGSWREVVTVCSGRRLKLDIALILIAAVPSKKGTKRFASLREKNEVSFKISKQDAGPKEKRTKPARTKFSSNIPNKHGEDFWKPWQTVDTFEPINATKLPSSGSLTPIRRQTYDVNSRLNEINLSFGDDDKENQVSPFNLTERHSHQIISPELNNTFVRSHNSPDISLCLNDVDRVFSGITLVPKDNIGSPRDKYYSQWSTDIPSPSLRRETYSIVQDCEPLLRKFDDVQLSVKRQTVHRGRRVETITSAKLIGTPASRSSGSDKFNDSLEIDKNENTFLSPATDAWQKWRSRVESTNSIFETKSTPGNQSFSVFSPLNNASNFTNQSDFTNRFNKIRICSNSSDDKNSELDPLPTSEATWNDDKFTYNIPNNLFREFYNQTSSPMYNEGGEPHISLETLSPQSLVSQHGSGFGNLLQTAQSVMEANLWHRQTRDVLPDIQENCMGGFPLEQKTKEAYKVDQVPAKASAVSAIKVEPVLLEFSPPHHDATSLKIHGSFSPKEKFTKKQRHSRKSIAKGPVLSCKLPKRRLALPLPVQTLRLKRLDLEKPTKLFSPTSEVDAVGNPNPFSAATTTNPFTKGALVFHSREWLASQQKELIKWLNALLTPPAELATHASLPQVLAYVVLTDSSQLTSDGFEKLPDQIIFQSLIKEQSRQGTQPVVDSILNIAELWEKSCRSKDLTLAPSRELVSCLYNTKNRLDALRRAACTLFRSAPVLEVLAKVAGHIENKQLAIRSEINLSKDVGLKRRVLELLLSYNPLWLRLGLEAVYGETIPLHSNSDMVGLATFIKNRLLSDPYIVRTHSHPTIRHMFTQGYEEAMHEFTLKKLLNLVFFLDQAKTRKLIAHDPCLFCKNSHFKSSKEMLLEFSREFLAGTGYIIKHLSYLGYHVSHKQTFLDEFDYAVTSLAIDLRDGIRLTRVMEIILQDCSLSVKLRTPPISILQKIHNVDVALSALHKAGFQLSCDIAAKDIVEGHKEKTLSLLWQLIYKFRAPLFTRSANTIQDWWRRTHLKREITRRIKRRHKTAAETIQAFWRGYCARKHARAMKDELTRACTVIQGAFREHQREKTRQIEFRRATAALTIQAFWRGYCARKHARGMKEELTQACTVLQRVFRAYQREKTRQIEFRRATAALTIQAFWRGYCARKHARAMKEELTRACTVIQRVFRAYQREKTRQIELRRATAALTIQAFWRGYCARKHARAMKEELTRACTVIQRVFRAYQREKTRQIELRRATAALTIQAFWRGYCARKHARAMKEELTRACTVIQRVFRAYQRKKTRQIELRRATAALTIQAFWRGYCARKHARAMKEELTRACTVIQRVFRAYQRKKTRQIELRRATAALTIQAFWRGYCARKHARAMKEELTRACTVIQRVFRAHLRRATAALTIQAFWRGYCARKHAQAMKEELTRACTVIQRVFRAHQREKTHKIELRRATATLTIQTLWRGYCSRKHARAMKEEITYQKELHRETSALTIQTFWRGYLSRRHFQKKKEEHACVLIQKLWRGYTVRKSRMVLPLLNKTPNPCLTLRHRFDKSIELLESNCSVGDLWRVLINLDTVTQLSPTLCKEASERRVADRLCAILESGNRSSAYTHVYETATKILINLVVDSVASDIMFQSLTLENLANTMHRTLSVSLSSKIPQLFCTCCTLLWLLGSNPVRKEPLHPPTVPTTLSTAWAAPHFMFSEPSMTSCTLYSAPMRTPLSIGLLGSHCLMFSRTNENSHFLPLEKATQQWRAIYNIPKYVTQLQFYLTRTKWEFMDSVDSKPSQQRDIYCSLQSKTKLSLPASKPSWSLKNKGRPRTFQTPGHAIKVLLKTFQARPP